MDALGIGAIGDAVTAVVNHFFPDKTQQEKDQAALELQQIMNQFNLVKAQVDVDQAEAASTDPLQHWRGAMGWVCVIAMGWHYVGLPVFQYLAALAVSLDWMKSIPLPPDLNTAELSTILMGMLGLGAMHTYQTVKGA